MANLVFVRSAVVGAIALSHAAASATPENGELDSVRASDAPSTRADAVRVGVELLPTFAASMNCSRDTDTVACEPGRGFLAFEIETLFPLRRALQLGPYLTAGFEGGARGGSGTSSSGETGSSAQSSQFGALGAELRFLPFASSSFWLGARSGLVGVRDAKSITTVEAQRTVTSHAWAPSAGGGLGLDVGVGSASSLSFSLRADYVMFTPDDLWLPDEQSVEWQAGPWISLGLGLIFDV